MDRSTRRGFLRLSGHAGMIGLTGGNIIHSGEATPPEIENSNDVSVSHSEDYTLREPAVQYEEQISSDSMGVKTETAQVNKSQILFADDFNDGTIKDNWGIAEGNFTEENGYIRATSLRGSDILYYNMDNTYDFVEYEFKHGNEVSRGCSVYIAKDNEVDVSEYDGVWPAPLLRVKHNNVYGGSGNWRAALVHTPQNPDTSEDVYGKVLASWGDPSNVNDSWHTYRIERHSDGLRMIVDNTEVGVSEIQFPESAWTGSAGLHFYGSSHKIGRWEQGTISTPNQGKTTQQQVTDSARTTTPASKTTDVPSRRTSDGNQTTVLSGTTPEPETSTKTTTGSSRGTSSESLVSETEATTTSSSSVLERIAGSADDTTTPASDKTRDGDIPILTQFGDSGTTLGLGVGALGVLGGGGYLAYRRTNGEDEDSPAESAGAADSQEGSKAQENSREESDNR